MPKAVIVADDLTGTNSVSILLKKNYLNIGTRTNDDLEGVASDVIVLTSNTRNTNKTQAYDRIFSLTQKAKSLQVELFSKRIDSTMRGNIGSEMDGMLDVLGTSYAVICTPAFPDSGRTLENGTLKVYGVPAHQSEMLQDPLCSLNSSNVKKIIQNQSKYKVSNVFLKDIRADHKRLSDVFDEMFEKEVRIIVCDAVTNNDIKNIAKAIIQNRYNMITADPGVLTAEVLRKRFPLQTSKYDKKILAVIGSTNVMAKRQMEAFWSSHSNAGSVLVDVQSLLMNSGQEKEIPRVERLVDEMIQNEKIVLVISDGIYEENQVEGTQENSEKIADAFGKIADRILQKHPEITGLYTSGGDISLAVYRRLGVKDLNVMDEVIPLAVYGRLMDGKNPNMHFVTKGGSQGNGNAIMICLDYLLQKAQEV